MIYEDLFFFLPQKSTLCQLRFLGTGKHHPEFAVASDRRGPRFLLASVASPSPTGVCQPQENYGNVLEKMQQEV